MIDASRRRAVRVLLPMVLVLAASGAAAEPPVVVFLGDSLSAGYGLGEELAFPRLVESRLAAEGLAARVVNAGVSGDTTAGGLARLDWLLRLEPDVVVVELGGNDGLRGLELAQTEQNLRQIVERSRSSGADVLLLGMRMPTNYGEYGTAFAGIFASIAESTGVAFVPFLLEGVGGHPELNLPDGIHPNAAGHRILAETVAPTLAGVLRAREVN